jgi:N-acyl-D-aspartate/D-glutamate deacylase
MYDLIIHDAQIIDGTGAPAYSGAIAVSAGRIAAVGAVNAAASEVIDAGGLTLAPGIVDLHTHYDAQLTWDSFAAPSPALGVTTVVIGNCGFTIAPCRAAQRDLTLRNLTHVEGMSLDALRAGVCWDFETYPQYLDLLERLGCVPNVASFFGHSSLRSYVMGEAATQRAASAAEIEQMRQLVIEAMAAGAIGFSTTTLEQHNGELGVPMPSRLAAPDEMLALTGALADAGRGVFMLTKGMTTRIDDIERIAANNGRPALIAAMFVDPGDPQRVFAELAQIEAARGRGRELWAEVGCFPLGMEFTLRHPYPLEAFLAWRPALEAADEASFRAVLAQPEFRAALKAEIQTRGVPNRFSAANWPHLRIKEVRQAKYRNWVGQDLSSLATAHARDPWDVLLDFGLDRELDAMLECSLFNLDPAAVGRLLKAPDSLICLSDAGAHLSFLCDAEFGLHLFGYWVRERGLMSLEQAVRRVSLEVAEAVRIPHRGALLPGYHADLLLFDPATVGRGDKHRVYDLPTGASRLDTAARGVVGVWVNGVRVVDAAGPRNPARKPGQLIRRFLQ